MTEIILISLWKTITSWVIAIATGIIAYAAVKTIPDKIESNTRRIERMISCLECKNSFVIAKEIKEGEIIKDGMRCNKGHKVHCNECDDFEKDEE